MRRELLLHSFFLITTRFRGKTKCCQRQLAAHTNTTWPGKANSNHGNNQLCVLNRTPDRTPFRKVLGAIPILNGFSGNLCLHTLDSVGPAGYDKARGTGAVNANPERHRQCQHVGRVRAADMTPPLLANQPQRRSLLPYLTPFLVLSFRQFFLSLVDPNRRIFVAAFLSHPKSHPGVCIYTKIFQACDLYPDLYHRHACPPSPAAQHRRCPRRQAH